MTDPEESKQYVGQSVDGDAAVDAMLRWRCQGAYASYPVANSDLLDNRGDGRRHHTDEGSGTKRRPPELTYGKHRERLYLFSVMHIRLIDHFIFISQISYIFNCVIMEC